ncbi:MAG: UpxY family transcription antiterminator [Bacteroidetes bacterium]|nr:UpxY family transcription antiterminator [Bacteroidota bacterium]
MDKSWFAIYVKSRTEKKVSAELDKLGIDHYLPLLKVLKQWSDRKKWVVEPLFKSYIFVHISPSQYYEVLKAYNVVRYISFEGKAVAIPPQQIEAIKYFLEDAEPEEVTSESWEKGQLVEVISGHMTGLAGELVEVKKKHKVRIKIEAINQVIFIQIPKNKLRIIY